MIYINAKYKTNTYSTGVDNVAQAYKNFLKARYKLIEFDYKFNSLITKNLEEQFFLKGHKLKKNDIVIHPTNTAPLRKLDATEILVLHDLAFIDYPRGFSELFNNWYQFAIPRLLKSKDHIITVSEFSKKRIKEHYNIDSNKISVVPNGIDHLNNKIQYENIKPRHFLTIGSATDRKNHGLIIQAHKKLPFNLRKKYPLKVVGGGNHYYKDGNYFEQIDEYIHLLGYVSSSDLQKLYIESIAYISASKYEGFGLPVIEALSYGKHIICSDIAPYREILGSEYDFLFSPSDDVKLSELMNFTSNNVNTLFRGKLHLKNRFELAEKYLWKNTLYKLKEVIDEFIKA